MTVLITGLGVRSCLGAGVDAFWAGMRAARSAPRPVPDPHAHMPHPSMYLVPEADVPTGPAGYGGTALGTASRYAVAAAVEAVADAGVDVTATPSRVAVVVGTGMGDSGLHEQWHTDGTGPGDPGWTPVFAPAAAVGGILGAAGPNTSISNACAASGFGLSLAADLIASGEADVVVAGGAEAYSRVALGCFNRLGAVDPVRCRPFDRHRGGTVFGEGAAILVLESAEHAAARGAVPYAELAGAGWSCDAYHATAPEPTGSQIVRAMHQAFDDAGVKPADVGAVVPHGTGTQLNDVVESTALAEVLGPDGPPLLSLKALIGHTGGAAGALAALAGALMVRHGEVPPSVPLDEPDPLCPVLLPTASVPLDRPAVLVNAYAFGGNNVSLVLQEVDR